MGTDPNSFKHNRILLEMPRSSENQKEDFRKCLVSSSAIATIMLYNEPPQSSGTKKVNICSHCHESAGQLWLVVLDRLGWYGRLNNGTLKMSMS